MKNNFSFEDYKIIGEIKNKRHILLISLFLLIVGIIILCKFKFYIYDKYPLIKTDNCFSIIVSSEKINYLKTNNSIYIDNIKYYYEVLKVDTDYNNINNVVYQTIYINIVGYDSDAVISNSYILKEEGTILNKIIKFMTGGIE